MNEGKTVNKKANEGDYWPTREQELLLRAALLQGPDAINAWHEWKASVELEQLDQGSLRLLPLLYQNLRTHGVEEPIMNKLKGVYRMTWYRNQTLFHYMSKVLRAFHDAAIQTMIIKGTALTLLYYKDYGLRPMIDFDVLVRTEKALQAIDLLAKLGWKPKVKRPKVFDATYISTIHARMFEDATFQHFDLHWHLLRLCCYEKADDDFWDCAVPVRFHALSICALNPTDQLLHACLDGILWDPVPPIRWVADAMIILQTSKSDIDWNRLTGLIQERRLILHLRDTLNYLRDRLNYPIPLSVLQSVQNMPVSRTEHMEYQYQTTKRGLGLMGRVLNFWFRYLRSSPPMSNTALRPKFVGLPRFFQHCWALRHLWQLLFYAVFRLMRYIWVQLSSK